MQKNCCIFSKIEENGKTFALLPPRPGSGMALNDDDDCTACAQVFFCFCHLSKLKEPKPARKRFYLVHPKWWC